MDNYLLDDLLDHLFCKSGNIFVDDFIRNSQINSRRIIDIIEFVSYDQFKDIKFIAEVDSYTATWIDGNIQSWDREKANFKRSGPVQVIFKKLNNFENITSKELNEVHILIIIYLNIIQYMTNIFF